MRVKHADPLMVGDIPRTAGYKITPCPFVRRSLLHRPSIHAFMIEKRRSTIEGWGVFATQPINKNTRIVEYTGEKISNRESLKREIRYLAKGHIWCFKLNRLYVRDAAVGGNIARYINHACKPNCYTEVLGQSIWVRAARNIRKGEELTYDYSTDGAKTIECRCRPGCPTKL